MAEKEKVIETRDCILEAISFLMKAIAISRRSANPGYNQDEFLKELGIIVGELDARVLCILYKAYPELDDLKNKGIL